MDGTIKACHNSQRRSGDPPDRARLPHWETDRNFVFEPRNWDIHMSIITVLIGIGGNLFKVYLVIKLWYFLIVLSGFYRHGRVMPFLDPNPLTRCLNWMFKVEKKKPLIDYDSQQDL
jgi:hypothetical protein